MPELPEVEVTRRSFADAIAGARVHGVYLGKPLRWPLGCDPRTLEGMTITEVRRRGKYLLIGLDSGAMLLVHLGMSGSLRFALALPEKGKHDHFELQTSKGVLRLHDPRRFGAVIYVAGETDPVARKLLGGLGMEPLSDAFTMERFRQGLKSSRSDIKQLLLAGKLVVGVGNIYASEALFRAGISPTVKASLIGLERSSRLFHAIREVLSEAVNMGGSSLKDFSSADGTEGHFQTAAKVYGRSLQPCLQCETPIRMLRQGQRSSFYCPRCQR
ncbi:bifunctional DNA-formamidopyrimidine glycosylase/DNA-(apurinic or apyrimidinic site) lyase [Acidovorax sp. DW039]|uniref:bifunctional DNA-formamidopyrimidine glycosylase/DNA-(apurinic or apyrimidinic site) lyase n=1 Tax=Acidovorax sp. DW039 TaxID=3095606 RepID=UPI0030861141|nr:bifunctional DNA-formamidopyrimidine glycosylase/DNA-(apurinic or apyrimidinic site) lyase [Acidovorax sp. DW039]